MRSIKVVRWLILLLALSVLAGCGGDTGTQATPAGGVTRPNNAIDITIVYAPESDLYMPRVIADFNSAFANSRNPITGEALPLTARVDESSTPLS